MCRAISTSARCWRLIQWPGLLLLVVACHGPSTQLAAAGGGGCLGKQGGPQWRVGIVPRLPPREIAATWKPVLKEVGQRSGQCFLLVVAPSIPAFEQQLRTGELDFAFLSPYHQVMAHRWGGFVPLVRDGEAPLQGILVVRKDSPVRELRDLNGATVAFPAPNAFAGSLLPRAMLARDGIRITPDYVRTHSNVYRSVILRTSVAGGGVSSTWLHERPEVRQQLRVLWRSPSFPAHPFAASGKVPVPVRQNVQAGFLDLDKSAQGRQLLGQVQMPKVVKARYERDYAPLEHLGLEAFVIEGNG
jgi:phosphonate transport system substrate-binding protein